MPVVVIAFWLYSDSPCVSHSILAWLLLAWLQSHLTGSRRRQPAIRARAVISREHRHISTISPRQTLNDLSTSLPCPWSLPHAYLKYIFFHRVTRYQGKIAFPLQERSVRQRASIFHKKTTNSLLTIWFLHKQGHFQFRIRHLVDDPKPYYFQENDLKIKKKKRKKWWILQNH